MNAYALAACLALGVPAETPMDYPQRMREIDACVTRADEVEDINALGQLLDVKAACLSYCYRGEL